MNIFTLRGFNLSKMDVLFEMILKLKYFTMFASVECAHVLSSLGVTY